MALPVLAGPGCGSNSDEVPRLAVRGTLVFSRADPNIIQVAGEVSVPRQADLFIFHLRSRRERQLTDGPGLDFSPAWSPDGRSVAFSREFLESDAPPVASLYSVDVRTGRETRLTRCRLPQCQGDIDPQWSPGGARIGFVRKTPQGPRLAYVGAQNGELSTVALDGGLRPASAPRWLPDGHHVAVIAYPKSGGQFRLYIARQDGSHVRAVRARTDAGCPGAQGIAVSSSGGLCQGRLKTDPFAPVEI